MNRKRNLAVFVILVLALSLTACGGRSNWKPVDWATEAGIEANGFFSAVHKSYVDAKASLMESAKDAKTAGQTETFNNLMKMVVVMNTEIAPKLDQAKILLDKFNAGLIEWKAAISANPNATEPSELLQGLYAARAFITQAFNALTDLGLAEVK